MYRTKHEASQELPKLIQLFKSNVNISSIHCLQNNDQPRLWLGLKRYDDKSDWMNPYDPTQNVRVFHRKSVTV